MGSDSVPLTPHPAQADKTAAPDDLPGMAEALLRTSSSVQAICRREASGLRTIAEQNRTVIPEYVHVLMLDQIAGVCNAIAVLVLNQRETPLTCAAFTALGRLPVEGVVYLNFVLSREDQSKAVWDYLLCDIAWRESYLDAKAGRDWHRRHGKPKPSADRPSRLPFGEPIAHVSNHEAARLDETELDWLQEGFRVVLAEIDQSAKGMITGVLPNANARLGEIRTAWNHLLDRLSGSVRVKWDERNGQWNRLAQWPLGTTPSRARDQGGLDSQIDAFLVREPSATPLGPEKTKEMWKQWFSDIGMEVMSALTHAGPTRVVIPPPAFDGVTVIMATASLLLATRILPDRYSWVVEARKAVPR